MRALLIFAAFLTPVIGSALECAPEDQFQSDIAALYDVSDLVFIGRAKGERSPEGVYHFDVTTVWKGPDVASIGMKPASFIFSPEDFQPVFAVRTEIAGQWRQLVMRCYEGTIGQAAEAFTSVESFGSYLSQEFGEPFNPTRDGIRMIDALYFSIVIVVLGGLSYGAWVARDV
jgi:hypothetical protein